MIAPEVLQAVHHGQTGRPLILATHLGRVGGQERPIRRTGPLRVDFDRQGFPDDRAQAVDVVVDRVALAGAEIHDVDAHPGAVPAIEGLAGTLGGDAQDRTLIVNDGVAGQYASGVDRVLADMRPVREVRRPS